MKKTHIKSSRKNIGTKTFAETTLAFRSKHIAFKHNRKTTTNRPKIATLFLWLFFVWTFERVADWISQM